jgi:hypothetical protein
MRYVSVVILAVAALGAAGCEGVGTAAQRKDVQGGLLGSALGAGAGAIIGNQSGNAGEGAAIGAGLGALGGALMGNAMQEQENRIQQQQFPPANAPASGQQYPQAPATTGKVKFSPVTGKEYPEYMKYDPETGVELKYRQ